MEELTEEVVALLSGVLIHPDQGKIEGFFVRVPRFLHTQELFLPVNDIRHWGSRIRIREEDVLSPLEDFIRLQTLTEDGRTILGQKIVTESGVNLGTCVDVQFDTKHFMLEWLFPRKIFRWREPVIASSIVRVKSDAIVVRDVQAQTEAEEKPSVLRTLDPLGTTAGPGATMQERT